MALLVFAAPVVGGCAAQGAEDEGSLVAIVPAAPVTVHNETYVTHVHVEQLTDPEASRVAVVRPPDPGCVPDDTACLEAACARGSGHGCEARADMYRDSSDERALVVYRRALEDYLSACRGGDAEACADARRLSAPGYGAHTYIVETSGCPDGYAMNSNGCVVPGGSSGPVGTTVIVNGNHNVVQVFGGAARVVGTSTKKTKSAKTESP